MKRILIPAVLLISILFFPLAGAEGEALSLDRNEYEISVDPSDEDQGKLLIHGTFSPPEIGLLEQVTVTLTSNITEVKNGKDTGRYWHSIVTFDDGAGTSTKIFSRTDGNARFTVELDPEKQDPATDRDIPVPAGIPTDVIGELVVAAEMMGAVEGTLTTTATIRPEEYHLLNLTTGKKEQEITAGKTLNYTFNVVNAGNTKDSVVMSAPLLEELADAGWNISLNRTEFNDMEPGDEMSARLIMVAPDEIPRSETRVLTVRVETVAVDPDSLEPLAETKVDIDLLMIKSKIEVNPPDDDDTEPQDDDEPGTQGYILAGVAAAVIILGIILILVFLLLRGRGGVQYAGANEDAHESMFRM